MTLGKKETFSETLDEEKRQFMFLDETEIIHEEKRQFMPLEETVLGRERTTVAIPSDAD